VTQTIATRFSYLKELEGSGSELLQASEEKRRKKPTVKTSWWDFVVWKVGVESS
jgi:hypothetical protein